MVKYNLTAIGGFNSTVEFLQNVNTHLMRDAYGILMLTVLAVIIYIAFIYSTKMPVRSITATSFLTFGFALLFHAMELIPPIAIYVPLVILALSLAFWNVD